MAHFYRQHLVVRSRERKEDVLWPAHLQVLMPADSDDATTETVGLRRGMVSMMNALKSEFAAICSCIFLRSRMSKELEARLVRPQRAHVSADSRH